MKICKYKLIDYLNNLNRFQEVQQERPLRKELSRISTFRANEGERNTTEETG